MLETILAELHNYFEVDKVADSFTIENGTIALPFLKSGQYFRVKGSILNDGVYQYPVSGLTDETFDGEVWALAVPKAVTELADEVSEWREANPIAPFSSESFGGYSYSRQLSDDGTPLTWRDAFRKQLNRWRKL